MSYRERQSQKCDWRKGSREGEKKETDRQTNKQTERLADGEIETETDIAREPGEREKRNEEQ